MYRIKQTLPKILQTVERKNITFLALFFQKVITRDAKIRMYPISKIENFCSSERLKKINIKTAWAYVFTLAFLSSKPYYDDSNNST